MYRWKLGLALVLTSLSLLLGGGVLADVVCRMAGIDGFDEEYARAKKVLGEKTTSNLSSCEVFVTKQGDDLYFHSNFVSEGAPYPTKIATENVRDLLEITANIYKTPDEARGERYTRADIDRITAAHKTKVKFYFDQSMFDPSGRLELDPKEAENLYVLFDGVPPPRRLVRANAIRGPPYVAEFKDSLFVHVQARFSPEGLFRDLASRPFSRRDVRLASLIVDSALKESLKDEKLKGVVIDIGSPSADGLRKLFAENSGRVVALVGHVEGDNIVARDVTGKKTLLEVGVGEVEKMAKEQKCDVIVLGCQSSDAGAPVGVRQPFNPVDAVRRFADALAAKDYEHFVRLLSSDDMNLVFGSTAFAGARSKVEADAFAKPADKREPRFGEADRVGRIIFSLGAVAVLGGGGPGGGATNGNGGGTSVSESAAGTSSGVGSPRDTRRAPDTARARSQGSEESPEADTGWGWAPGLLIPGGLVVLVLLVGAKASRRS
jgi:hypothetical protein